MPFGGAMAMIAGGRSQFDCALGSAIRPGERQRSLVPLKLASGWVVAYPRGGEGCARDKPGKTKLHGILLGAALLRSNLVCKEDRIDLDQSIS
jgi:hypothetical protein